MSEYSFNHIDPLKDSETLQKGIYLCIIHADKIPPHIGLSIDGEYFSLKAKGKDVGVPVGEVIKIVSKKSIKTLFVRLNMTLTFQQVFDSYANFSKTVVFKTSCLSPIKAVFPIGDDRNIQKLTDLLVYLESKNVIKEVFGVNIDETYSGIPYYEVEDIHKRLELLIQPKV